MGADQDAIEVGGTSGSPPTSHDVEPRLRHGGHDGATSAMVADLRRAERPPAAAMRAYTDQERAEATAE